MDGMSCLVAGNIYHQRIAFTVKDMHNAIHVQVIDCIIITLQVCGGVWNGQYRMYGRMHECGCGGG